MIPCPFCTRGTLKDKITGRQCDRCGVYVPVSTEAPVVRPPRSTYVRPDQDRVRPMTDYIRTQQDKE